MTIEFWMRPEALAVGSRATLFESGTQAYALYLTQGIGGLSLGARIQGFERTGHLEVGQLGAQAVAQGGSGRFHPAASSTRAA